MKRTAILLYPCAALVVPGCTGDDQATFFDTDPTSTGDPTTGSGTSGGDTDTEGTTGEPECVYPESLPGYTALREDNGMGGPAGGPVVNGNLPAACSQTFSEPAEGVAVLSQFYVYRPAVGMTTAWPDQCLPLVVFSPPAGGNPVVVNSSGTPVHTYAHIFDRLAEEGFVVVATQAVGSAVPLQAATNTERAQLAQCAIEWARNQYADYLSDDIALVGHSRGGAAVSIPTRRRPRSSTAWCSGV